jgi:hypothetical protein
MKTLPASILLAIFLFFTAFLLVPPLVADNNGRASDENSWVVMPQAPGQPAVPHHSVPDEGHTALLLGLGALGLAWMARRGVMA